MRLNFAVSSAKMSQVIEKLHNALQNYRKKSDRD